MASSSPLSRPLAQMCRARRTPSISGVGWAGITRVVTHAIVSKAAIVDFHIDKATFRLNTMLIPHFYWLWFE